MKRKHLTPVLIFFIATINLFSNSKPNWAKDRPVDANYYIGIAMLNKKEFPNYLQIAKTNALNDLISEIKVNISSSFSKEINQENNNFNKKYSSNSLVTSSALIENYELVDTWEDSKEYWVYYRLSKQSYEKTRYAKVLLQIQKAKDLNRQADILSMEGKIVESISFRYKALISLNDYIENDLYEVNKGKDVQITNDIVNKIQSDLNDIVIQVNKESIKGKVGVILPDFDAVITIAGSPAKFINLLSGTEESASFDLATSDINGVAHFSKTRVSGLSTKQQINVFIDLSKFYNQDSTCNMLKNIFTAIKAPMGHLKVDTDPVSLFYETKELNSGSLTNTPFLSAAIKSKFSKFGCIESSIKDQADYTVSLDVNCKDSDMLVGGRICSILTYVIKIIDVKSNNIIFIDEGTNIKGFHQSSSEKAGQEAYKKALTTFNGKIISKLIAVIFNSKSE